MRVFRLSRKRYAYQLNGIGASKFGNRWNSKGTEIIYTAESRALAMAEVAVHLSLISLPKDYMMIEINVPDQLNIKSLAIKSLPDNWDSKPAIKSTQKIGDEFVNTKTYSILKVPSAVVQGDFNYLINPHHDAFKHIKIMDVKPFPFDKRLVAT